MTRDDNPQFILPAYSLRFVQVPRVPRPNIAPPPTPRAANPPNAAALQPFYHYPHGHVLNLVRESVRVHLERNGGEQPIPRVADQPNMARADEQGRFIIDEQPRLPGLGDREIPRFIRNATQRREGANNLRYRRLG